MQIGIYSLRQNIRDESQLTEVSQLDYNSFSKTFVDEKILKAPDVFFLGHLWNILLGVIKDRIYKISAQFVSGDGQMADTVYSSTVRFCSKEYGSPLSNKNLPSSLRNLYEKSGYTEHEVKSVMVWKTSFGNVILDHRSLLDDHFVNLHATLGSLVNESRLLLPRITPIRTVLAVFLSTVAAYSFSLVIDLLFGRVFGVYPNTALLAALTWSIIAVVAFWGTVKIAYFRSWLSAPFIVFGALALLGALVGAHPHSYGVAAVMLIAAVFICYVAWRTS
jgi:hypothetical protein